LITLMLADDHPVFASGLRSVFDAETDMTVLSIAATGREAVLVATEHQPDVAVLDINMPDGDGLWVCDQLRAARLGTRALILTMYDDDENVLAALRAGAYGYILKELGRTRSSLPSVRSPGVRLSSVLELLPRCSSSSAARRPHRRFRSSPNVRPRCWRC
jgi:DNA-binding NarL/FixJ family response regulator